MQQITQSQVGSLTSRISGVCAYLFLKRFIMDDKSPLLDHFETLGDEIHSEASEDPKLKQITDKINTVDDAHVYCEELMNTMKEAATRLFSRWPDDFRIAAGEEVSSWEEDLPHYN